MGLRDFPLWGLFKYSALCILQMNVLENHLKTSVGLYYISLVGF